MANETYNILQGIFSGQTPIQRTNPMKGQSEYYYMKPNQNSYTPLSQMQTVDVPTKDTPNPYLTEEKSLFNKGKITISNILGNVIENYPTFKMGEALGTLIEAKKEMDKENRIGGDNYAHRLGMCLNAQDGLEKSGYSLGLGLLKEGFDIYKKTPFRKVFTNPQNVYNSFANAVKDSYKDIKNNMEGIRYGLRNPDKSCRVWLEDLDLGTNTWKK